MPVLLPQKKKVLAYPLPATTSLIPEIHLPLAAGSSSTTKPGKGVAQVDGDADEARDAGTQVPVTELTEAQLRRHVRHLNKQAQEGNSSGSNDANAQTSGKTKKGKGNSGEWQEPEVFLVESSGEVFLDYEEYASRIMFYRHKVFQCEYTGASKITFEEALQSEYTDKYDTYLRFPAGMRGPILKSCQFALEGRLDDLVDKLWDRFHDRFFPLDKVYVEIDSEKLIASVAKVIPSTSSKVSKSKANGAVNGSSSRNSGSDAHSVGTNLNISLEDSQELDDPSQYRYVVNFIQKGDEQAKAKVKASKETTSTWKKGKQAQVSSNQLSRDRLWFNKIALKKYLRDWLERDVAVGSPWMVKRAIADRFGISNEMSSDWKQHIEELREVQLKKRRRPRGAGAAADGTALGDEDAKPPAKKKAKKEAKDPDAAKAEKAAKRAAKRAEKAEAERLRKEQEERERIEAEKRRRRPTKFPAEDLLVELTDRELKEGKPVAKPCFNRMLPFREQFPTFTSIWNFLNSLSHVIALSPFTIDEFENALYHSDPGASCLLTTEIHAALLNVLSADTRIDEQPETLPLKAFGDDGGMSMDEDPSEENSDELTDEEDEAPDPTAQRDALMVKAAEAHAEKWMNKELSAKDGRSGWAASLRSTEKTLPNLRNYLLHLLFEEEYIRPQNSAGRPTWSTASSGPKLTKRIDQRYTTLHPVLKLEILDFLCELTCQTKLVRDWYEESLSNLTRVRNEQTEVKREIRKINDELDALEPSAILAAPVNGQTQGQDTAELDAIAVPTEGSDELDGRTGRDSTNGSSDSLSNIDDSENDDVSSSRGKAATIAARQKTLQVQKAQREAEAAQRAEQMAKDRAEQAAKRKEKNAFQKEKAKLETELAKWQDELTRLDGEFRKAYCAPRPTVFGTDRFGNRYWWFDGCGTAELIHAANSHGCYGTGRLYVQGAADWELEQRVDAHEFIEMEEIVNRRDAEEPGDARLKEDEWAAIEDMQQLADLRSWLNPKGLRESKLLHNLNTWSTAIESSFEKRLALFAVPPDESNVEGETDGWLVGRRAKRQIGPKDDFKGSKAYLAYKNTLR